MGIRHITGSLCLLFSVASGVSASSSTFYTSAEEQVPMLELYTSHGCSSCPPADAWLRQLSDRPDLWRGFVPLAFHVDYWDRLGWPDRFANVAYSDRQRQYARNGGASSVYTPGFFLSGREWRGFFRGDSPDFSAGPVVGRLTLELDGASHASVRFAPDESRQPGRLTAHLAIVGFGLKTQVSAGENRGRALQEDFVVLGYSDAPPQPSEQLTWLLDLPDTVTAETSRRAIVAWVSADADPTPLQAVAGWLPDEFR